MKTVKKALDYPIYQIKYYRSTQTNKGEMSYDEVLGDKVYKIDEKHWFYNNDIRDKKKLIKEINNGSSQYTNLGQISSIVRYRITILKWALVDRDDNETVL